MKKKSLKDIEDSGFSVIKEDQDRIDRKKANAEITAMVKAVTEKLGDIASANDHSAKSSDDNAKILSAMHAEQRGFAKQITGAILSLKPHDSWEFNVKRNEKGFISKIFAKGV